MVELGRAGEQWREGVSGEREVVEGEVGRDVEEKETSVTR